MSRSQLHRKLSALTGLPLTEFVRNYRLDRARTMLAQGVGSVTEIAWRTGFANVRYFSTCFREWPEQGEYSEVEVPFCRTQQPKCLGRVNIHNAAHFANTGIKFCAPRLYSECKVVLNKIIVSSKKSVKLF